MLTIYYTITIRRSSSKENSTIKMHLDSSIQYIGVIIDIRLCWSIVLNSLSQAIKILFYALVESRISYGILRWG